MEREDRKRIFAETADIVKKGKYVNSNGNIINIPFLFPLSDNSMSIEDTTLYDKKIDVFTDELEKCEKPMVEVLNMDCLCAAKKLIDDGLSPAVLNMASFSRPGGGVLNGSGAQEENLCRRTSLFRSIFRFNEELAEKFGIKKAEKTYPLNLNYGAVYSPCITVFRSTEDEEYKLLDEPFIIDVISVAGIKNPTLDDGKLKEGDKEILRNKIKTILKLGLLWGNDSLVLGALGCGAFHTPADEMAKLFKEIIYSDEYYGLFKNITFAILEDKNSRHFYNPNGNFKPFKDILSK